MSGNRAYVVDCVCERERDYTYVTGFCWRASTGVSVRCSCYGNSNWDMNESVSVIFALLNACVAA